MLKLLKYDFTQSYRAYGLIFSIFLMVSFLSSFIVGNELMELISRGIIVTFVISLFVLVITNVIKFYNESMFKDSGYLTLTLPVSTYKIVLSKIITTAIWHVITVFVLLLGMFLSFLPFFDSSFIYIISELFKQLLEFSRLIFTDLEAFLFVLNFILSSLLFIIKVYFVITAIQTKFVRKNKLAIGIMLYVLIELTISTISGFFFERNIISQIFIESEIVFPLEILIPSILIDVTFMLLFYYLTVYIIDNMLEI